MSKALKNQLLSTISHVAVASHWLANRREQSNRSK